VKKSVTAFEGGLDGVGLADVAGNEVNIERLKVSQICSLQIEDPDLDPHLTKLSDHMAAHKTGTTSDQGPSYLVVSHWVSSLVMS
jgi:hypothetical protein